LRHCVVWAELERVLQPMKGPEDPRWEGTAAVVKERFRAEQLLEKGEETAALSRFRRVAAWAQRLPADSVAREEHAAARAAIGWVLACRAAPILDLGTCTSEVLKAAKKDVAEAEDHCAWLEEQFPAFLGTLLLRAKLLVAQDDDFAGAHKQLLEAQRLAPSDARVQEELRKVKVELRKVDEEQSKRKIAEIRDSLKRARTGCNSDDEAPTVMQLLRELSKTRCSWDTVMETRIGVELKCCSEGCGDEARQLCNEILGRMKDESREQRPMWAT